MIEYTCVTTEQQLMGILDLQHQNLLMNLDEAEIREQGFVTVRHSIADLQSMNAIEPHVIAVENERVVGYLLAMTVLSRNDIPVLVPMFETIDRIEYEGHPVSASSYIVVGQACVDKSYRGKGIFDGLYSYYAGYFKERYDYIITEIDDMNKRSLRAHRRVGFKTINEYVAPNGITWHIVLWDGRSK
jgi:GNAT superfamily N-acetyltransferase